MTRRVPRIRAEPAAGGAKDLRGHLRDPNVGFRDHLCRGIGAGVEALVLGVVFLMVVVVLGGVCFVRLGWFKGKPTGRPFWVQIPISTPSPCRVVGTTIEKTGSEVSRTRSVKAMGSRRALTSR